MVWANDRLNGADNKIDSQLAHNRGVLSFQFRAPHFYAKLMATRLLMMLPSHGSITNQVTVHLTLQQSMVCIYGNARRPNPSLTGSLGVCSI